MTAALSAVHLPVISNSELRTFRRCAREHHFSYRLRRRTQQKAEALRFGTLLHVGLEAWWRCEGSAEERLGAGVHALRAGTSDPFDLAKAEAMLVGYTARWGDEPMEVLAVEAEFDAALRNPLTGAESRTYRLGGKVDCIVKLPNGRVAIVEHKTTSEEIGLGASYWRRVSALDSQASIYHVGARSLGHDVEVCIFDVMRKPGQRPAKRTAEIKLKKDGQPYANQRLTDETPDEYRARVLDAIQEDPSRYFARGEVVRLEHDEQEAALDTWQTARLIREAEVDRRYPRNPDACVRFGRTCEYLPVCSGEAGIDDDTLFRTADAAHEELSAPEEIPS